jgi:hypothetical protein
LALSLRVVGEKVARKADSIGRDAECAAKEVHEDPNHLGVRVREHELVSVPRPLGPIEHAPDDVELVCLSHTPSAIVLSRDSADAGLRAHRRVRKALTLVQSVPRPESRVLLVAQLDIADPEADGRFRHTQESRDLLDRTPFVATHPSG